MTHRPYAALAFVSIVFSASSLQGGMPLTEVLFSLDSPETGPFPSDLFTIRDATQNTGRRISLPKPDCDMFVSDCEDLDVINQLDGFNLRPMVAVSFSRPIDLNTVTSSTVFLLSLGSTLPDEEDMPPGTIVGIDQIVWDPNANTLHAESDALLAQHTRFALIVTSGVRDASDLPVRSTGAFPQFRAPVREDYRQELVDAIQTARRVGLEQNDITVASVFTTQSATAIMEKIRRQIHDATPEAADFLLGTNGERTVFDFNDVTSITWRQQKLAAFPYFNNSPPVSLDLQTIRTNSPGAVGRLAFGKFVSPDYEVHPDQYIPPVGTRSGTPAVQGWKAIYFNLYLPSGPKPVNGWPVAISGHGVNGSKNVLGNDDGYLAQHGIATVIINAVGNGFGEMSTLTVSRTVGDPVTFSAGGRGIDQNMDGAIVSQEGNTAARPRKIALYSDGLRQTVADLMQLTRVIEIGMDVDGDGTPDLDPSRIYYTAGSWGAGYGTLFMSIEPDVQVGLLSNPIDSVPVGFLGVIYRTIAGTLLTSRQPSLLNAPGIWSFDGLKVQNPPLFDDNRPLRDQIPYIVTLGQQNGPTRVIQSPVTNTVAGAMAIQEFIENCEWVSQVASPAAYAPHLRTAPLRGVPAKRVIYRVMKGDQTAPNPTTTATIRSGGLADVTLYYRHDLARSDNSALPTNPHAGAFDDVSVYGEIAKGALEQVGTFLEHDGRLDDKRITQPEPARYFEFPIAELPEGLNYIVGP